MSYQPKPSNGYELWAWVFMRLSGVFLLFLALGHLFLMHIVHTVEQVSYAFVAQRFTTPFWRIYDWLLLALALLHGTNGLRTIIRDYVHGPMGRKVVLGCLYLVAGVLFVVGTWTLVAFQPEAVVLQTAGLP